MHSHGKQHRCEILPAHARFHDKPISKKSCERLMSALFASFFNCVRHACMQGKRYGLHACDGRQRCVHEGGGPSRASTMKKVFHMPNIAMHRHVNSVIDAPQSQTNQAIFKKYLHYHEVKLASQLKMHSTSNE
jgi:hypothetical protein